MGMAAGESTKISSEQNNSKLVDPVLYKTCGVKDTSLSTKLKDEKTTKIETEADKVGSKIRKKPFTISDELQNLENYSVDALYRFELESTKEKNLINGKTSTSSGTNWKNAQIHPSTRRFGQVRSYCNFPSTN